MGYTTSSVSRRVVMAKVKTRPGARKNAPPGPRPEQTITRSVARVEHADVVPLLFARTVRAAPIAAPAAKNRLTISLIVLASAALLFAIYALFAGRRAGDESAAAKKSVAKSPAHAHSASLTESLDPLNPRAMKYAGGRSLGSGEAIAGASLVASAALPPALRGDRSETRSDEIDSSLLDGRKLVLPADVSGSCEIGENGVGDLGSCFARNGARTQ